MFVLAEDGHKTTSFRIHFTTELVLSNAARQDFAGPEKLHIESQCGHVGATPL